MRVMLQNLSMVKKKSKIPTPESVSLLFVNRLPVCGLSVPMFVSDVALGTRIEDVR